jgi:hypothetical protein
MDNIVDYVKVDRSTVLKFELFACSEEKTSTDDMASLTQSEICRATL